MSSPKVSVLIPTYNYGRYLPDAIESVLRQDFEDYELIISDDGSTDDTASVIAGYATRAPSVRIHRHHTNLGMVANWNWCLREAKGEYVKFLFGDDCLAAPHALGQLVALLDKSPQAAIAASARFTIDEHSNVTGIWDDLRHDGLHSGPETIVRCLKVSRNLLGEPTALLLRRQLAIRGFDLTLRQIVDLEMWFHLLLQGDLVYTTEPLCCFRQHRHQQTAVNRQAQTGYLEMAAILRNYLPALSKGPRPLKAFTHAAIVQRALFHLLKKDRSQIGVLAEAARLRSLVSPALRPLLLVNYCLRRPLENLRRSGHKRRIQIRLRGSVFSEHLAFLRALRESNRSARPIPAATDTPRILLIRRRYLGDIVLLGPILRALRLHWPHAHITVMTDRVYAPVLALNSDADQTTFVPTTPVGWLRASLHLVRARYTHVLDLDNRPRTALVSFLSRAGCRIALHHGPHVRMPRCYTIHEIVESDYLVNRHITGYYARVLRQLQVPVSPVAPRLNPRPVDIEFVRHLPEVESQPSDRPKLFIHPGSRSPHRIWPAERFAAVIHQLRERNVIPLLIAGPGEQAIVREIQSHLPQPAPEIARPLTIPQLAALFTLGDALLCHDSGPMHLAAAVGTRVIALFSSQNLATWGPLGNDHVTLQAPMPCNPCLSPGFCVPSDSYHNHCVRHLTVEQVLTAVQHQLRVTSAASRTK